MALQAPGARSAAALDTRVACCAPDPLSPYLGAAFDEGERRGKRWRDQHVLHAKILAASRELLAQRGLEGATVRAIADRCQVSTPTVYNIAGDRKRIISEASAEWVVWLAHASRVRYPHLPDPLSVLWGFWSSALHHPDYTRRAARCSRGDGAILGHAFEPAGIAIVRRYLRDLDADKDMKAFVDLDALSTCLVRMVTTGVSDWAYAPYDAQSFRTAFVSGPGAMLLGAARGAFAERLEAALGELAASAALD